MHRLRRRTVLGGLGSAALSIVRRLLVRLPIPQPQPGQSRYELRSSTWQVFDSLLSAGGGVYFGHRPSGWTQKLLSAQPRTVA